MPPGAREGEVTTGLQAAVDAAMHLIATGIEVAGVAIIVTSAAISAYLYLREGRRGGWGRAYERFRANLGRGILLGLELLVAADIIGTVAVTPSFENLGVLAAIVLIRTFLSVSLDVEIEGRWPWQRHFDAQAPSTDSPRENAHASSRPE
jgi:uncharacterized membrane protein